MAIATSSPERHSQLPVRSPAPNKRQLRVVRSTPKQPPLRRPRAFYIGPAIFVLCLLGVVGAQVVSMQNQVAITNLQSDLTNAQNQRYDLQLKVADEEQPSVVVQGAGKQGMVVPPVVHELPAAGTGFSSSANSTSKEQSSGSSTGDSKKAHSGTKSSSTR